MMIPRYWAEASVRHRESGRQITVRRFGWSDHSQADAQAAAEMRAGEALSRVLSGEKLPPREPKIPYNGADGVPIREEILDQRGDTVITRNSYGARCLNSPSVFFADIDFPEARASWPIWVFVLIFVLMGAAAIAYPTPWTIGGFVAAVLFSNPLVKSAARKKLPSGSEPEELSKHRVRRFIERHPSWNLRLYRTPAGLRVLATHQLFDPSDPAVSDAFKELGSDPVYGRMCVKQQCFRARVSPKPWRIGITDHLRPRPGTWPVKEAQMPVRNAWIARYEAAAGAFASCVWIESLGSGVTHPDVLPVQVWHDELSRAGSQLPIA